jgi:glyoxylase-like metal-dependent hydrolase (beta-lactamase superfamily II)/8-oxo-dGTP pyrophosphatase MutT (NUDIX family)
VTDPPETTDAEASAALPRPSATVVLVRPGPAGLEVLLVERPSSMAFAGGLHAFPGGTIDPGDRDAALAARSALPADDLARAWADEVGPADALSSAAAAIRELFEETGVLVASRRATDPVPPADLTTSQAALLDGSLDLPGLVARLDLDLGTNALVPLSRWVTPRELPRRFDTLFYVAELPPGAQPSFAKAEVAGHDWVTPRAGLDAIANRKIRVLPPTSTTLQQLEHVASIDEVRERLSPGGSPAPGSRGPVVDALSESVVRVGLPAGGGIPGQTVNAYLLGRRELVLVDPGDPGEAAGEAILAAAAAKGGRIVAIVLTHADPDHAAGALGLGLRLDAPIFVGPGGGRELPYDAIEIDRVGTLDRGDEPFGVFPTPGHRSDHLAFVMGHAVACGDTVGRLGSRSAYGKVDVDAWRASLGTLARLDPQTLLPGHGRPIVGREAVAAAISAASARQGSAGG